MLALRTFSKLYGLAGLRVGYGVGPAAVVAAMRKVQRGYDVGALAQVAALASLADAAEVERRRAANREAVAALTAICSGARSRAARRQRHQLRPRRRRRRCRRAAAALLARGVAVQSGAPFGAPTSLRIRAGTAADLELLDAALAPQGSAPAVQTRCNRLRSEDPPGPPLSWPDGRAAPVSVCGQH